MRIDRGTALVLLLLAGTGHAAAQSGDGQAIFRGSCAACHTGAADARAPSVDALRSRTPQAVIESLLTGAMRAQGSRLSGAERRAVAEYVTGKAVGGDVRGADAGRCIASGPTGANTAARNGARADARAAAGAATGDGVLWRGWSPSITNTRLQPAAAAGLTAADLPRLQLKWALGFPDASVAWAPPTLARGRLFVGSQNGTVYALDARSGCLYWTFSAAGGVRTAITVSGDTVSGDTVSGGGAGARLFFGDTSAQAYALDLATGREIWRRKIDDHPLARITGSPAFHRGRLYVPMSSYEESQGADPQYGCCTFRGSVTALEAATGQIVWKTSLIDAPVERRGTSSVGVPLWGPSGSAIWSAPTIDERRRAVYVATGNTYSGRPQPSSDAVVALDLDTGAIRWMRQATAGDVYVSNCRPGNANCPDAVGPDHDFGSPPALARVGDRELLVIGQKSGLAFAMDPDRQGELVWQYRAGQGGLLGGIEWGAAIDDRRAYFAVSDILQPNPGGLHAVDLATGARAWVAPPPRPACLPAGLPAEAVAKAGRGCNGAQSAAVTVIPGVVFSGSNDGSLRAFAAADGAILWEFDTNREFQTVNGVPARGASILGPGPVVGGGMVYTNSGYGAFGGRPGNVLLAFGFD